MNRPIALVGLPATGKTVVGAALAGRLGVPHADIDAAVERRTGCTVTELVDRDGRDAFRHLELEELDRVLRTGGRAVISCGGGLFARDAARALLRDRCTTVLLDAPDRVLLSRAGDASDRPWLRADPPRELARLRAERDAAHREAAYHVDASGAPDLVATRVLAAIGEADVWIDIPGSRVPVLVGTAAAAVVPDLVPAGSRTVVVIADRSVRPLAQRIAGSIRRSGRVAVVTLIDGGEGAKTWASAGRLLRRLSAAGVGRGDCVVAAGGGTVGDLAGFVAAVYMRGVALIQVPTTLLAMVDSAIGGKTAVNLPAGKNLAGAIAQPVATVCDLDALDTLPDRARRSACGEIVKHAMIADGELGPMIERGMESLLAGDHAVTASVVRRNIAIKGGIVAADPRESGLRALLNYGHTVAHAVESVSQGAVWHGEAVAIGLRVAGLLSVRYNNCPPEDVRWQDGMLDRAGLTMRPRLDPDLIVARTAIDKKASGGRVRWVLADRRGHATTGHALPAGPVRDAVAEVLAQ